MDATEILKQEKEAQVAFAIRVLGQERYNNSDCQAHPLELVEQFIAEQSAALSVPAVPVAPVTKLDIRALATKHADRIPGFNFRSTQGVIMDAVKEALAAASPAAPDDFEDRLAKACRACDVSDPVYEALCIELKSGQ